MPAGIETAEVLGFALTAFVIELTPGPNMAWLAILTIDKGRRAGAAAVAGVSLGLAIIGVAAAFGLATLLEGAPVLTKALGWAGALYLLWLAWDGWRDSDTPIDRGAAAADLPEAFRRGLVTNLLNPKAAIFYLTVLPNFLGQAEGSLKATLFLTAVYVAVATLVHLGIVFATSFARHWLLDPSRERLIRRGLSALLGLVALWFLWGAI